MKLIKALTLMLVAPTLLSAQATLNLTKGKTHNVALESTSTVSQGTSGKDVTIKSDYYISYCYKVTDITPETTTFSIWYDRYKHMSTEMPATIHLRIDTSIPAASTDYIARMAHAMVGKPVTMILDNTTGQVVKTLGAEELFAAIADDIKAAPEDEVDMGQYMTNVILKGYLDLLEGIAALHPSAGNTGSEWTTATNLGIITDTYIPYAIAGKANVAKSSSKYSTIDVRSAVTNANDNSATINGVKVQYNLSGTYASSITVSNKTGWLKKGATTTDITGTISSMGREMPVKVNIKTKLIGK